MEASCGAESGRVIVFSDRRLGHGVSRHLGCDPLRSGSARACVLRLSPGQPRRFCSRAVVVEGAPVRTSAGKSRPEGVRRQSAVRPLTSTSVNAAFAQSEATVIACSPSTSASSCAARHLGDVAELGSLTAQAAAFIEASVPAQHACCRRHASPDPEPILALRPWPSVILGGAGYPASFTLPGSYDC